MATKAHETNLKVITSGSIPTISSLPKGSMAFGRVDGVNKIYGNATGVVEEYVAVSDSHYTSALSWAGSANNYTMSIPSATHGKGINARIFVDDGTGEPQGVRVIRNPANGNISLYSDSNFTGTVTII